MIECTFEHGAKGSLRHVVTDNLILRGDEILLVRRAQGLLEGGKWGLAGGFMERDETIVESVKREVLEETGYEVSDVRLLRIVDRPDRPAEDRQNISFVHVCKVGAKIGQPDTESTEQRWFPISALPAKEEVAFDHYENIQEFLKSVSK